ncbi:MAG: adhesin [Capnocytophaga sp.]|nr:adhesin [Capnocytophaga sp.]
MKIHVLYFISLWLLPHLLTAQEATDFSIRYQTFLHGEIRIIGNAILSRDGKDGNANVPYNIVSKKAKSNDEHFMRYIDIDDDPTTFSSSSATFADKSGVDKSVVYAGLYWTATYPYNEGAKVRKRKFKPTDAGRENPDTVLFKKPDDTFYTKVKGEAVYDGFGKRVSAPYLYYADVTELLAGNEGLEGEYTVANVRATNGVIEGGTSAGWALVFVYRDSQSSLKKIISYDGFSSVYREDKVLDFTGFSVPDNDDFDLQLLGAALEADLNMTGNRVDIYTNTPDNGITLQSPIRPKHNFFNSTISRDGNYVDDRNPNSKNTLGFDIFQLKINNPREFLFKENNQQLKLLFTKSKDRYHLFLTALQIETNIVESGAKINVYRITTKDVPAGYYNVVGVFMNENNIQKISNALAETGCTAKSFYIPKEGMYFVYTNRYDTLDEAFAKCEELKAHPVFSEAWVLYVKN